MKNTKNTIKNLIKNMVFMAVLFVPSFALASSSVGTIDSGFKLTKVCQDVACTTYGNANWKPTLNSMTPGALPVTITDSSITGHIWGDQIGWINLAPTGAGIFVSPSSGVITGKAFATGGSWINFNPTGQSVTLVDNGSGSDFFGWAWVSGPYGSWMKFDCSGVGVCIKTDWRTVPNRIVVPPSGGGSGGGGAPMIVPAVVVTVPKIQNPTPTVVPPVKTPVSNINTPTIKVININDKQPTPNTFDKNNDVEPDALPPKDIKVQENLDAFVRQIFPKNEAVYQIEKTCSVCIIIRKEKSKPTANNQREKVRQENKIIKIAFISKSLEKPLYISKKVSPEGIQINTGIDMTSVLVLVVSVWIIRKIVGLVLL
jgi:hypothetical protein